MGCATDIDTLLLACTHYPLLQQKIEACLPEGIKVISKGEIVAASLKDYLQRHPEMERQLTRTGSRKFFTTSDDTADFDLHATRFFNAPVTSVYLPTR